MDVEKIAFKHAIRNALLHEGKSDLNAVVGKVFGELKGKVKNNVIIECTKKVVNKVNSMRIEDIEKIAIEMGVDIKKECKEQKLPELSNINQGVVTRFAPSPTGPLNLGQFLRAVMLNYYYAKHYNGKFILRFEDTDAKKIESQYYNWILEDLKNSEIEPDVIVYQSDRIEIYYTIAENLIKNGKAYVCTCSAEKFRELKKLGKKCECRDKNSNYELWKDMLSNRFEEGEAVLRFKSSMCHPNPVLRDPPLMRINKATHPRKGKKYSVWPLYNFACAIDDHMLSITHIFRGKEHEHNTAVQKLIYDAFSWNMPIVVNFGMIYLPGSKFHTRDIKEKIKKKELWGWDDPRLHTLRALYRRGIKSDALKKFALQCGLSKTDINASWENIYGINRKVIDSIANRYMVVIDPVKIKVKGAPKIKEVYIDLHPDYKDRGKRKIPVTENIYISKQDFENFNGYVVRLKNLFNVELKKEAHYVGDDICKHMKKIQWVSEPNVNINLVMPDASIKLGIGEIEMKKLKKGQIIQMERIGFGRVDSISEKNVIIFYAHK